MESNLEFFANWAEILGGATVIFGIVFGMLEYRRNKASERREAAAALARSFQTRELASAIRLVLEMPEPMDRRAYERLAADQKELIWLMFTSMESIGILVHRGNLPLELVDEFFSLPVQEGWRLLSPFVEELREQVNGPQAWEWYQWLQERLSARHREKPRRPAFQRHADWKAR